MNMKAFADSLNASAVAFDVECMALQLHDEEDDEADVSRQIAALYTASALCRAASAAIYAGMGIPDPPETVLRLVE